jgi:hypothetical protein
MQSTTPRKKTRGINSGEDRGSIRSQALKARPPGDTPYDLALDMVDSAAAYWLPP